MPRVGESIIKWWPVSIRLPVCRVPRPNSKMEKPRRPKIGAIWKHVIREPIYRSKGQRSRSPGRLMLRSKVCHVFRTGRPTNFKLGTQTADEDPYHRQVPRPPRSKVKVERSRAASDNCWPISQERKIPKNKIGRKVAHGGQPFYQFCCWCCVKPRPLGRTTSTVALVIDWFLQTLCRVLQTYKPCKFCIHYCAIS